MTNWWWLWCGWGCRNGPGWCNRHCPLIRCSWMRHPFLADLASMKTNEMQTPLIKFPFVSAFLLPFTQVSPYIFFFSIFLIPWNFLATRRSSRGPKKRAKLAFLMSQFACISWGGKSRQGGGSMSSSKTTMHSKTR